MENAATPPDVVPLAAAFNKLVRHRRATPHFRSDPVPESVIATALTLAGQAPSGYNLQPWRFLVLRDAGRRAALRGAAMDQAKITEAPVMVVAFGRRDHWPDNIEEILRMRSERTRRRGADPSPIRAGARSFVERLGPALWLNRQVMLGFTFLMLAFEALGWDTAPMEGFDGPAVRAALGLPSDAEVVALLAVGRALDPDPAHPGRLPISAIAFDEDCDHPFAGGEAAES